MNLRFFFSICHCGVPLQRDSPFVRIISRDLPRTFPDHDMFKDPDGAGQESLLNILKVSQLSCVLLYTYCGFQLGALYRFASQHDNSVI